MYIYLLGMWRDHVARYLARSDWWSDWWQYLCKTFCSVYIRAASLIVKKLRSWFKHPCNLVPEWQWFSYVYYDIASVSGARKARFVAAHVDESEGRPSSCFRCECCHSLIWASTKHALLTLTTPLTPVSHRKHLKDIQICIHAAADPERATQSLFNHTELCLCYRHLNNRSTGIKVYSLGINTYCLQ